MMAGQIFGILVSGTMAHSWVLSVLLDPVVREERAVLVATHDVSLACSTDRVLVIDGGRVSATLEEPTPDSVLEALRETGDAA